MSTDCPWWEINCNRHPNNDDVERWPRVSVNVTGFCDIVLCECGRMQEGSSLFPNATRSEGQTCRSCVTRDGLVARWVRSEICQIFTLVITTLDSFIGCVFWGLCFAFSLNTESGVGNSVGGGSGVSRSRRRRNEYVYLFIRGNIGGSLPGLCRPVPGSD